MSLQQNIELLRCLYHLDLFRRSIRKINHANPLMSIRDLFNSLTVIMSDYSENNINPVIINNMISSHLSTHQSSWGALKEDAIYERICKEMDSGRSSSSETESSINVNNKPQQIQPLLRYNLSKICTTCGSSTPMNGCVKDQYIISMEPIETITLEEQIIASLDSNEFCEKSNCFGHQRTLRILSKQPNIFTFDFRQTSTKVFNLHEFFIPSLVFSTQQDSIYKITAITLNPASSLVYHSRLNIWLFINHNTIKPLCSNFNNLKFNFNHYNVQLVFYTIENLVDDVIYENWKTPTTMTTSPMSMSIPTTPLTPKSQTVLVNDNLETEGDSEYYDSGISSYNSSIETNSQENQFNYNPPSADTISISNSTTTSMSGSGSRPPSTTNYATIKRNRTKCKNIIKSISVPNLSIPSNLSVKRKVSFNCDIELIDLNEEYNPHPILLKILEKMKL